MGRSIVISGATGYVGAYLCRQFVEADWRVLGLVRQMPCEASRIEGMEYVEDVAEVKPWVGRKAVTWINLVGVTKGSVSELTQVNESAQWKLAEMAKAVKAKVIHFSSINVFLRDEDPYGSSKSMGELVWEHEIEAKNLCILRPGLIYGGAEDARLRGLHEKMQKFRAVPGVAHGQMAPLFLEDLGTMVLALATKKRAGRWIPQGPDKLSYSDFVQVWNEATSVGAKEIRIPKGVTVKLAKALAAMPWISKKGRKLGSLQRDRSAAGWGEKILGTTSPKDGLEQTWKAMGENEDADA